MYTTVDIKKVHIDTRFKTLDSLSDSNFWIELPRSLNVPDDCVCYVDDIFIPVAWSTVDARNNKLDLDIQIAEKFHRYRVLTLPSQTYVSSDLNDNLISIKLIDHEDGLYVRFVSDVDLIAGVHWDERLVQDRVESLSGVLRVDRTITLTDREPTYTA